VYGITDYLSDRTSRIVLKPEALRNYFRV
jgi:hypothetical protein